VAELAAIGLTPDDYADEVQEIWPETEVCISLFSSVSTQLRMGFSGPVGLDYSPLFYLMGRMGLTDSQFDNLFYDIRIAESEALSTMNSRGAE